jgi:hypothetical protein
MNCANFLETKKRIRKSEKRQGENGKQNQRRWKPRRFLRMCHPTANNGKEKGERATGKRRETANRRRRHDFPTPLSPMRRSLKM